MPATGEGRGSGNGISPALPILATATSKAISGTITLEARDKSVMLIGIDAKRKIYAVLIIFLSVMASGNTDGQIRAGKSDPPKLSCRVVVPAKSAAADANVTEVSNLEWIRVEIQLSGGGLALAKMIVDPATDSTDVTRNTTLDLALYRLDGDDRSKVPVRIRRGGRGHTLDTERLSILMEIPIVRETRAKHGGLS